MPLYAYRCESCQNELEVNQRMSENPLKDCPSCGEPSLRRVINRVGVVFKGSGFYVTDTKSNNPAAKTNGTENKTAEKSETSPPAETKSASTPAEKVPA